MSEPLTLEELRELEQFWAKENEGPGEIAPSRTLRAVRELLSIREGRPMRIGPLTPDEMAALKKAWEEPGEVMRISPEIIHQENEQRTAAEIRQRTEQH